MKFIRVLDRISDVLNSTLEKIAFVFFVVMTLIVWAQIFYRYALGDGIIWGEEVSKYLMVWMALLAAAIVHHDKGHISMEFFVNKIKAKRLLAGFQILAGLVLFAAMIYYGFEYAEFGKRFISPASGLRRFWPYLAIPIGGAFLLFYSIVHLLKLLFPVAREENGFAPAQPNETSQETR